VEVYGLSAFVGILWWTMRLTPHKRCNRQTINFQPTQTLWSDRPPLLVYTLNNAMKMVRKWTITAWKEHQTFCLRYPTAIDYQPHANIQSFSVNLPSPASLLWTPAFWHGRHGDVMVYISAWLFWSLPDIGYLGYMTGVCNPEPLEFNLTLSEMPSSQIALE
jgi:hypothetical protein